MHYRISCPNGHTVQASPDLEGRQAVCPICEVQFTVHVPAGASTPSIPSSKSEHPKARLASEAIPAKSPQSISIAAPAPPQATAPASSRVTSEPGPSTPSISTAKGPGSVIPSSSRSSQPVSGTASDPLILTIGRALLLVGLVLVLLSKGCDTTGSRAGARARAKILLSQNYFDYEWEQKLQPLVRRLQDLDDQIDDAEDSAPLYEESERVTENLADLQDQREKEERELRDSLDKDIYKAVNIESKNAVHSYWRGWAFVIASTLLAVGLCLSAWNAVGPERWICLSVLLVIIYSVYVGGAAWNSSPSFDPFDVMSKSSIN